MEEREDPEGRKAKLLNYCTLNQSAASSVKAVTVLHKPLPLTKQLHQLLLFSHADQTTFSLHYTIALLSCRHTRRALNVIMKPRLK